MYHLKQIPTETKIKRYLRRILFGKNIYCPECRSRDVWSYENRYRCKRCRIKFSLLSHTWLSSMRISLTSFWLILWCWTKQVPVKQTTDLTNLSEKAIRHWFELFRHNLPQHKQTLEAIIQLDEAYFRRHALMLGKQKGTRKIAYRLFPHHNIEKHHAYEFLERFVKPQSSLRTDGGSIYKNISLYYPIDHKLDIHKKFEFTNTAEIEGMFGVLRTFIRRMYHHVTPNKFPDMMSEFYFRFSQPEMFKSPYHYLTKTLSLVPSG